MTSRIVSVLFLCAAVSFGASTRPAKPPQATRVAPATQPTAKAPAKSTFARDVFNKYQERRRAERDSLKIAYIDLDRPIGERPAPFVLLGETSITFQKLLGRLHQATTDKDIRAILLNIGQTEFNLAQAMEIRDALTGLRKANKRAFVYADAYDTPSYVAASGATDVCLLSGGEIMIPGVGLETMFYKGLLDKVGVKADYIQIGQYKGAEEPYTRVEPSAELRGELNKLVDGLYDQLVDSIANSRNISRQDVVDMVNGVMLNARAAKERKFVDHLVDQDGLRDMMKKEMGREIELLHGYGMPKEEEVDMGNPLAFLSALTKKPAETDGKPKVAVVYAEGVIVDGEADDNLFGGGDVGSTDFRKYIRMASRDQTVKAIVIRIDSPGGSALASEVMWQAVRRAAKEKPIVISIGGMAASGGYYLASSGDYIFADPAAIVGSIGVVGGKFVVKDLFKKVGLNTENFSRGANADLFAWNQPFTDQQRRLVTNWMQQTYDQFTDRVMTTRKGKIAQIDDVARGRIFLAKQAKQLGMVDEIGGIDAAIAYAAQRGKLEPGTYETKLIPGTRTLLDIIRGLGPEEEGMAFQPKMNLAESSVLKMLPPRTARLLMQQVQVIQLLQRRPVVLVSPYVISVK